MSDAMMRDQRLEQLEKRLARAERDLASNRRRGRCVTGVAVAGVSCALIMAFHAPAADPEPLTVRAPFRVLDASGRSLLNVDDAAAGRGLTVMNGTGDVVATVISAHDGGQVRVRGSAGAGGAAGMWITKEGAPRIMLAAEGDAPLATLGVEDSRMQLNIFNKAGANVVKLGVQPNSGGQVAAYNADHSGYSALGANDAGQAGVRIKAGDKLLVELGAGPKGNGRLLFYGGGGKEVAGLGNNPDGSGGRLFIGDAAGLSQGALSVADGGGQLYVWGPGKNAAAQVGVDGGKGVMRVYNGAGQSVVWMNESAGGAGHVAVTDPGGAAAAEMGYNGTGIVRALGPGGKIDWLRGPR